MTGGRWATIAALCVAATAPFVARAQAMREVRALPADCRAVHDPTAQTWQAFVRMEHCDRMRRLQRLSALLPSDKQPRFYEGVVPAARLPADFGVDVPVLRVVFPERTFFDTADARLRAEAAEVTAIVAESLRREPPDVALFVAGHADARGGREYNQALSIARANALAEAIFARGIAFSSIWRIGFGEDMPLVGGGADYANDRNRRIEFLFAAKPEAVGTWLADQQIDGLCQARDSTEAARCRTQLTLKREYEAVEIARRPPVAVRPQQTGGTAYSKRPNDRKTVVPGKRPLVAVQTPVSSAVAINPQGTRRISIDPIARRTSPIRIDL